MTDDRERPNSGRKRRAFIAAFLFILVGVSALMLYRWWAGSHLKTDDAFVESDVHLVASRVPGTIIRVAVDDNEKVSRGQVLVELDPEPYLKSLEEAEASLRLERERLAEAEAKVKMQERKVAVARAGLSRTRQTGEELAAVLAARGAELQAKAAALDQAALDLARAEKLAGREVIPKSRLDRAETTYEMAAASLAAAEELVRQTEAAVKSHEKAVAQAEAALRAEKAALDGARALLKVQAEQIARRTAQAEQARLRHSWTTVTAPADGYVTRMSAEVGNTVQAGQPLMSLVNMERPYVVANYKETRVGKIRPGQKVVIRVDALPGRRFDGTVDSVMAGTGAAFTLFPPENASGNYVKVVQRIPVKITFDDPDKARGLLAVGMSVVPTILVD